MAEASRQRGYVLAAVTAAFTLNRLDAVLVGLFLQPMKNSLALSDTQLGFVTGIAFGVFYAVLGVPMARWADYGNRVTMAAVSILLWGATLASYLFVASFAQLALIRVVSAIGEAGCMPSTYSLIGDYYPEPRERTRAMAIYWLSGPIAALIGFLCGGWLGEILGWRKTFCLAGCLGLAMGAVLKFTVRETRCQIRDTQNRGLRKSLRDVVSILWGRLSLRCLIFAFILLMTSWVGLGAWEASFLVRSHAMGVEQTGIWLGLIYGLGGLFGVLLGGYVSSRWLASDEVWQVRVSALMIVLQIPCYAAFLLLHESRWAVLALVPVEIMCFFYFGPTFALIQRLVADEMRARTLALVMLVGNLLGMGFGPQLVGLISDALQGRFGADSLRYAMLITSLIAAAGAAFFWAAGRTVKQDLKDACEDRCSPTDTIGVPA